MCVGMGVEHLYILKPIKVGLSDAGTTYIYIHTYIHVHIYTHIYIYGGPNDYSMHDVESLIYMACNFRKGYRG